MKALQDEFLANGGEYKTYKLEELFTSENGDTDLQQKDLSEEGDIVVTSGVNNCGILGYSNVEAKVIKANTITIDMFGNVFYRDYPYKMVTHARVFALTFILKELNRLEGIYIATQLFYLSELFSYGNMASWKKVKDIKISLPTIANGEVAFDFMASLIRELEAERISELEAYLKITGFTDFKLKEPEIDAISLLQGGGYAPKTTKLKWKEFRIVDLFSLYKLAKLNPNDSKEFRTREATSENSIPAVVAKVGNNGIMYYVKPTDYETTKNKLVVIGDGAVASGLVYYQPDEFTILHNAYAIQLKDREGSEKLYLYLQATIQKAIFSFFGYENKPTWNKVKECVISLPTKEDGSIDYDYMESLIGAIQKQVIEKVVAYKDEVIAETRQIVQKLIIKQGKL